VTINFTGNGGFNPKLGKKVFRGQVLIAEADWRLRRAARAEVGEIRRQTDSYYARQNVDLLEDVEDATRPFWTRAESKSGARNSWLRIQHKVTLLERVRIDVEKNGYVGEELQHALDSVFGNNHRLADSCHRLSQLVVCRLVDQKKNSSPDLGDKEGDKAGTGEDSGGEKDVMLRLIKLHADGLKQLLADLDQAEDRELQAKLLACNLPSREFVDKLIRYETAQENKKNKAIALLLKLQSRKG